MIVGADPEDLVDGLKREVLQTAETVGLKRRVIIMLAQRLKPAERLDFDQALTELERAVEIAVDIFTQGEHKRNEGEFVEVVLRQVVEKTVAQDLDGAARALDDALADIDRQEAEQRQARSRTRIVLLEVAIKQQTLRRDMVAVVDRIEQLVTVDHASERPAWLSVFASTTINS